jgi:hypothetical protein
VISTLSDDPKMRRGTVLAAALQPDDELAAVEGEATRVVSVERMSLEATVYNLEIEGHASYFVGSGDGEVSLWVHNAGRRLPIHSPVHPGRVDALQRLLGTIRTPEYFSKHFDELIRDPSNFAFRELIAQRARFGDTLLGLGEGRRATHTLLVYESRATGALTPLPSRSAWRSTLGEELQEHMHDLGWLMRWHGEGGSFNRLFRALRDGLDGNGRAVLMVDNMLCGHCAGMQGHVMGRAARAAGLSDFYLIWRERLAPGRYLSGEFAWNGSVIVPRLPRQRYGWVNDVLRRYEAGRKAGDITGGILDPPV